MMSATFAGRHCCVENVLVSRTRLPTPRRRDIAAAHGAPVEVVTDSAAALAHAIAELIPNAAHDTDQYANNRINATTDG